MNALRLVPNSQQPGRREALADWSSDSEFHNVADISKGYIRANIGLRDLLLLEILERLSKAHADPAPLSANVDALTVSVQL